MFVTGDADSQHQALGYRTPKQVHFEKRTTRLSCIRTGNVGVGCRKKKEFDGGMNISHDWKGWEATGCEDGADDRGIRLQGYRNGVYR